MFNFVEIYSQYSNIELLKIVEQPHLYQAEAVKAAQQLLNQRQITDDEKMLAQSDIAIAAQAEPAAEKLRHYRSQTTNAIKYLFTASPTFEIRKWIYWLCIGIGLYNLPAWIQNIEIIAFLLRRDHSITWIEAIPLISLVYVLSMIVLLVIQNKGGWIMLVAMCCYEITSSLGLLFLYWERLTDKLLPTIIITLIFGSLLQFLAKPRIVVSFKASYQLYRQSITASTIASALLWLWLMFQK